MKDGWRDGQRMVIWREGRNEGSMEGWNDGWMNEGRRE